MTDLEKADPSPSPTGLATAADVPSLRDEQYPPQIDAKSNIAALDGLRGLAAAVVCCHHWVTFFWLDGADNLTQTLPFSFFLNGPFMVSIFYVLSGRVLADGFYRTRNQKGEQIRKRYLSALVRRPFRLCMPVILIGLVFEILRLSTLLERSAALFQAYILPLVKESRIAHGNLQDFAAGGFPSLKEWIQFWLSMTPKVPFDYMVLWTLSGELRGSYIVYVASFLTTEFQYAGTVFLLLSVPIVSHAGDWQSAHFLGGLLLCHFQHYSGMHQTLAYPRLINFGRSAMRLACFVYGMGVWTFIHSQNDNKNIFKFFVLKTAPYETARLFSAVSLVYLAEHQATIRAFLTTRPMRYLGRISFGIYVLHPIVESLVGTLCIVYLLDVVSLGHAVIIAMIVAALTTVLAGHVFDVYLDKPVIATSSRIWSLLDSADHRSQFLESLLRFLRRDQN